MRENPPIVSVLLPAYAPDPVHFRIAVESVLAQTFQQFELLVLEDPSNNPVAPMLAGFSDLRIRHILAEGKGSLVDSLNRGLAEARGEFIARMDADDVCSPTRFEEQVEYLRRRPEVQVLGSQLRIIDQNGGVNGYREYPTEHEDILAAMPSYNAIAHPTVLFRKECVLSEGGYRAFFTEDYELWSRLATQGVRFGNHPDALLDYRVIPEGIRAAKVRKMLDGTLEVKRLYWRPRMRLKDRLRMWGEQILRWVPPGLVLRLFMLKTFKKRAPKRDGQLVGGEVKG